VLSAAKMRRVQSRAVRSIAVVAFSVSSQHAAPST
jgi:hypothetical protein